MIFELSFEEAAEVQQGDREQRGTPAGAGTHAEAKRHIRGGIVHCPENRASA